MAVFESPAKDRSVPLQRETIAAFVGPAIRGPVDIPVTIESIAEFRRRFGSPIYPSRMEYMLEQYFHNGGASAIVIRAGQSLRRSVLGLPGLSGSLQLEALNPGPYECLRASVDFEDCDGEAQCFNLVIQRINSPDSRLVEEQETFAGVSTDREHPRYVKGQLERSRLVRLAGAVPAQRPNATIGLDAGFGCDYVYARTHRASTTRPTDHDLIGQQSDRTGLHALDQIPDVDLVVLIPGVPEEDLSPVALFAAERYCRRRDAILLIDPPATWTTVDQAVQQRPPFGLASPNVVTYYPRLAIQDGRTIGNTQSALGALAGCIVAGDRVDGVWNSPGQFAVMSRFRSVAAAQLNDQDIARLTAAGISPLIDLGGGRIRVMRLQTLARGAGMPVEMSDFCLRRTITRILDGLRRLAQWSQVRGGEVFDGQAVQLLATLHGRGILVGDAQEEAWFFQQHLDGAVARGDRHVDFTVGMALRRPGEFLVYRVTCDGGESRVRLIGWQRELAMAS